MERYNLTEKRLIPASRFALFGEMQKNIDF